MMLMMLNDVVHHHLLLNDVVHHHLLINDVVHYHLLINDVVHYHLLINDVVHHHLLLNDVVVVIEGDRMQLSAFMMFVNFTLWNAFHSASLLSHNTTSHNIE